MPPDPIDAFRREGFVRFDATDASRRWAEAAWNVAQPRIADPSWRAEWLRCEGTWFAGVDLLPNGPDGSVNGCALAGPALDLVNELGLRPKRWHLAQVSVTYPGYPKPKEGESAGAARFRLQRDAAHVDGLLPEGQPARRFLREPHAFILGIALTDAPPDASPLVVWPGSQESLSSAFRSARRAASATAGDMIDLTDTYQAARRSVFETYTRTEAPLRRAESILLHRHMLHGIAPWRAPDDVEGRAIAYFRPEFDDIECWY